jgi:tetratricopeptide (TPR) repeat protein
MHGPHLTSTIAIIGLCLSAPVHGQDGGTIDAARTAASQDRNRDAADLFAKAISEDPSRREVLLREYAAQLTYSERSREAVPLYREVLAGNGLSASERGSAIRGLALALAWSGQHRDAIAAYGDLLEIDPEDLETRMMRGKVLLWSRNYLSAIRDFSQVLDQKPDDVEGLRALAEAQSLAGYQRDALAALARLPESIDADALRFLARTQLWSGRPNAARDSLAKVMVMQPNDPAAISLLRESERATKSLSEVSVRYSDQSDASDFWQVSGWQSIWPSEAVTLSVGYDGFYFDPADPALAVDVHRPAVAGRARVSDALELNGQLGITLIDGALVDRERMTWNAWGTFAPSDRLRFDAGFNRSTLDNARSNQLGIYSDTFSGSADIGSDAAWKLSARAAHSDFSDGNDRDWGQLELRRRVGRQPNLFLGARFTHVTFDQQLNNGYFDPDRLSAFELTTQAWGRLGAFWYDLRGAVGREEQRGADGRTTYSAEARLTYDAGRSWQVEAYVNSFSSRIEAPGGFSRTTTGLTLRNRW